MDLKEVAEEVLERCCTEELICEKTTMFFLKLFKTVFLYVWEVKIGNMLRDVYLILIVKSKNFFKI